MRRLFRRQEPHNDQDDRDHEDSYDDYDYSADYQEPDIEPFVPVSGDYYDDFADDAESETATVEPPTERRRVRPRLPRIRLPGLNLALDWSTLLLALFLFAAGVFGVLLKQGDLARDVEAWWPLAMVIVGVLWMVIALVRRQVASFLGGSAFAGLGLSLLLETQDIAAVEETMLGMVLVAVGLGIVMRGFLLRQQVS